MQSSSGRHIQSAAGQASFQPPLIAISILQPGNSINLIKSRSSPMAALVPLTQRHSTLTDDVLHTYGPGHLFPLIT